MDTKCFILRSGNRVATNGFANLHNSRVLQSVITKTAKVLKEINLNFQSIQQLKICLCTAKIAIAIHKIKYIHLLNT